jgi:pyruvate dehydrogenase E1 component alpha subunit
MDPKGVMAELTGRADGYSKGKGGSMHMFSRDKNFYGGHGIVAAQVPLGTGLAFGHKYKNDGGVTMAYFGDGAINQGQVYESFNMAALWKLPIVYVIENNKYGMGTSIERASSTTNLSDRGAAHGLPGAQVDGMDVVAVKQAAVKALQHCRSGQGPFILEMKTYRYRGHSMSDPAKYRSKEEVSKVRKESDPIDNLRHRLLESGLTSEEDLKEIDRQIKAVVTEAATFAQESPQPDAAELYTDILLEV